MPEDRFGDLRAREPKSAADRLSELDAQPAPDDRATPPEPPPPRPGSRYGWVVAVVVFVLIAAAAINTLPNVERGTQGPEPGSTLPDFAAASLDGGSEAGPNIRQEDGEFEEQSDTPACDVHGRDVVNICELRERPVVLTFVARGCEQALDRIEALRPDFPRVKFVGVVSGDEGDDLQNLISEHDWAFPVALDPDLLLFNLYRAADCPTTVTAKAGGEVVETRNGELSEGKLRELVERVAGGPPPA